MNSKTKQSSIRNFRVALLLLSASVCLAACGAHNPEVSPETDAATGAEMAEQPHYSGQLNSRVTHLPYFADASFTPHWITPGSDSLDGFHRIPDFSLLNQNGKSIAQANFNNCIYVTDFFFTSCPGICPKMTKNMALLQDVFADDNEVMLVSHSVTPRIDSVAVLRNYADSKGVKDDKWHLLTGDRDQIYALGRQAYFVEEDLGLDKSTDDFLHTENFVLIDKHKHIRGIYNGINSTSIQQLIADIRTLKSEG